MADGVIPLQPRVAGDTWVVYATLNEDSVGDPSDWTDPVFEVRAGLSSQSRLLFTSRTDDAVPSALRGTVSFDGDEELEVPALDFAEGVFSALILPVHSVTCPRSRVVYAQLSVVAPSLNGKRTVGTFSWPVVDEIATEPAA